MRRRGRQSLGVIPETKPWGQVINDAMMMQLDARERDEEWMPSKEPGWIVVEDGIEKSVTTSTRKDNTGTKSPTSC